MTYTVRDLLDRLEYCKLNDLQNIRVIIDIGTSTYIEFHPMLQLSMDLFVNQLYTGNVSDLDRFMRDWSIGWSLELRDCEQWCNRNPEEHGLYELCANCPLRSRE